MFCPKAYFDKQLRIKQGEILWRYFSGSKIVSWNLILQAPPGRQSSSSVFYKTRTFRPGEEKDWSWAMAGKGLATLSATFSLLSSISSSEDLWLWWCGAGSSAPRSTTSKSWIWSSLSGWTSSSRCLPPDRTVEQTSLREGSSITWLFSWRWDSGGSSTCSCSHTLDWQAAEFGGSLRRTYSPACQFAP